jgi:streptogramin lyase
VLDSAERSGEVPALVSVVRWGVGCAVLLLLVGSGEAVVTEFPIPTAASSPQSITAGPDGNLWFTERAGNKIGRITPAGVITEYPVITADSEPYGITALRCNEGAWQVGGVRRTG